MSKVIHESKTPRYVVQYLSDGAWEDDEAFYDEQDAKDESDTMARYNPHKKYRVVDTEA